MSDSEHRMIWSELSPHAQKFFPEFPGIWDAACLFDTIIELMDAGLIEQVKTEDGHSTRDYTDLGRSIRAKQVWSKMKSGLKDSLIWHVRKGEHRWRDQVRGQEALKYGLIACREYPKHHLTKLGIAVGKHGLEQGE